MISDYIQNNQNQSFNKDEGYIDLRKILTFIIRNKVYIFQLHF